MDLLGMMALLNSPPPAGYLEPFLDRWCCWLMQVRVVQVASAAGEPLLGAVFGPFLGFSLSFLFFLFPPGGDPFGRIDGELPG